MDAFTKLFDELCDKAWQQPKPPLSPKAKKAIDAIAKVMAPHNLDIITNTSIPSEITNRADYLFTTLNSSDDTGIITEINTLKSRSGAKVIK